MNLKLGVVYNRNGEIINHRSLVKVVLNPFLRFIGFQIATVYYIDINKLGNPTVTKCPKKKDISFNYNLQEGNLIRKERILI
jgi:hypothetical protein